MYRMYFCIVKIYCIVFDNKRWRQGGSNAKAIPATVLGSNRKKGPLDRTSLAMMGGQTAGFKRFHQAQSICLANEPLLVGKWMGDNNLNSNIDSKPRSIVTAPMPSDCTENVRGSSRSPTPLDAERGRSDVGVP